ncbi:MAG: hypothetical protein NTW21_04460 [Verrucomicrobia bacterium]|nr:hypothetical protein [Verrucomicrobiota bacterium]
MIPCRQPVTGISRDPTRGFALVITLTLMILLTVIAVGLLTLSSITMRASTQGKAMQTARDNARMALVLAIGELQKYAGQDQRITATADMAGATDGTPLAAGRPPLNDKSINNLTKGLSAVQPGTRYWTGVFANKDTPASIFTKTPSPTIVHWLVSGNTTAYPAGGPRISPADAAYAVGPDGAVSDAAKAVVLVGRNSVGKSTSATDRYVAAPLVNVLDKDSAKPVGRFAWWVGDEGVKAKINGDKTSEDPASYAALCAQRRGWETVDGFAAYPVPAAGTHTALPKLVTLGETALLVPGAGTKSNGTSPLQSIFHSATTESRAVLTDSLNGGTKIDLTAILAGTLPTSKAVATIANYPVKGTNIIPSTAATTIKAPKWDALKDFADRAKSLESGALIVKAASSDIAAAIAPLVTDFRLLMGARLKTKAANSFNINPCAKIAITLANPYSCPLKWKNALEVELLPDTPPNNLLTCIWSLGAVAAYLPSNPAAPAVFNQAVFRISPASLAPGEARAYTMGSYVYRSVSTGASSLTINLVPVDPYTVGDFTNCIELENPTPYDAIGFIDVREEWQTSCATIQMRLADSSNILRRVERLELDQCQWPAVGRSFTNAEAEQLTQPIPLLCHSFQISQPGEDYEQYMPAAFEMGQRSSTLRTYADFNLQATRLRKPITSYNPPPYFTEWTNSASLLPPVQPLRSTDHGGETGTTFTRNLATTTIRWGRSHVSGSATTILFSIPPQLASLAQLQHADLTGDDKFASVGHQPGNAVGNSYASPFVKRKSVSQSRTDYQIIGAPDMTAAIRTTTNYYDISYLLNASLWDGYFFSTIPRSGNTTPDNPSFVTLDANDPSGRLRDPVTAASLLMLDGAFNCNSTDKNAWKAFLASAKHFKHAADSAANTDAAFPRTLEQISTSANPPTGSDADSFSGYRRLTDKQLDDLAGEIVKQVRLRGPFVSLSHFVNRALADLTTQPALTRCGALQGAIDESGANINFAGTKKAFSRINTTADKVTLLEKLGAPRADYDGTPGNYEFTGGNIPNADPAVPDWAATSAAMNYGAVASILANREMFKDAKYKPEQGYRSTGIPGWLTQADVLQVIGPSLTARSDTFRIRTFGEALDSNGITAARVYCEAVVQRVPAYIDPANPPSARGATLTTLNQTYGRQFQIVAFRWLSPDEI